MKTQSSSQVGRLAAMACFLFIVFGLGLVSTPVWALTWTPDLRLSTPPDSIGVSPAIASGQNGEVHVVWVGLPGDGCHLNYKRWDGTAWSETQELAFSQYGLERPAIAVDSQGNVHVVFDGYINIGEERGIYYTRWDGVSWSQVYLISEDETGGLDASIAADINGNVHVVWYGLDIYYKRWDGSSWMLTEQLNDQHYYTSIDPCLTGDANGDLHVAWITWLGYNQPRQIYYKRWNGESWSADSLLVDTPGAESPALAPDASGNSYLTWIDGRHGLAEIYCKRWDGAAWAEDELVYSGWSFVLQHPTITVSDYGIVHVAWTQYPSGGGDSQLLYKLWNGQEWEPERTLATGPFSLSGAALATDTYGNVHLVWQDGRHYNPTIYHKMRKHCLDGDEYEDCRWYAPDRLFYARFSADADTLSQPPGVPVFYDSTRVTISRGPNDRFYVSGEQYALADWICDDKLYIDGVDAGLGFAGVVDSALTLCQPIENVLVPVSPRDVTSYIPEGQNCVTFKLADTQRTILGNTQIYLVRQDVSGVADGGARVSPTLSVSPNPTQLSALFELSVPATGQYALTIYSVDGRLVRSYPEVRLTAGEQHHWTWDGRDQLGETAGQGVYFGAIRSSACQTVKKLLIVR